MKVVYLTESIVSTFPNVTMLLAQPHQTVTLDLSRPSYWFIRVPVPVPRYSCVLFVPTLFSVASGLSPVLYFSLVISWTFLCLPFVAWI